ncbi:MAG: hypothetical protein ACI9WO_001658 [Sphingobacteriales bacterium]|jgi:hypothetical protein
MLQDLPENEVHDIAIAVVLESSTPVDQDWSVYLINLKEDPIDTVIVASKGYGILEGKEVKTSVLRHLIGDISPLDYKLIEPIKNDLFGLSNEYWLSFYQGGVIFDKKFVFVPESIIEENMIPIPFIGKPGVMIR